MEFPFYFFLVPHDIIYKDFHSVLLMLTYIIFLFAFFMYIKMLFLCKSFVELLRKKRALEEKLNFCSNKESSLASSELVKDVVPQHLYFALYAIYVRIHTQVQYLSKDISMTNNTQGYWN